MSNGRCLDCGKLVPNLSKEELESQGWEFFGTIMASGFPRHNWRCGPCVDASIQAILKKATEETKDIRERERAGEFVGQDVMEFRMREPFQERAMAVRSKVRCTSSVNGTVCFSTVYEPDASKDTENARFTKATPWGDIRLGIDNPAALSQFEPNKEYYVDFTPAG